MSEQIDPSLKVGNNTGDPRARVRYPSPFFDLSQQYIPPTVKELFKWVYFYATSNSFLGPALQKIAKYPVTDLVFEDEDSGVVDFWTNFMTNTLRIKTFNMEANLDLTSYGNGFVTIHYPFTRLLECGACKTRSPWKAVKKRVDNLTIKGQCPKCRHEGPMNIVDVPFRSADHIRLIRINPEYIDIKYNETTGKHTYLYSIPDRLKKQIMAGDPDILEDTPLVYIESIKQRRKIKLSSENLFHMKNPTLAGKDMGWGMPRIASALKDLYHYYVLRRAQEAVMHEHIVPFDIIYPQANSKMDPYVNTDLSMWKKHIERELSNRRRDPNHKAVLPVPIGYQRIGGDGKALMLTPEMDFLSKVIIGACGIPQEFVFGGSMQWSGSSIALRTLENDFLHQRSQLHLMNSWVVQRVRLYLGIASPKSSRFTDFKMADDVQRQQIMLNMASSGKLPWEDLQREFGRDPKVVRKKLQEEAEFDSGLLRFKMLRDAESQASSQQVATRTQRNLSTETTEAVDKVTADTISALAQRLVTGTNPEERQAYLKRIQEMDSKFYGLLEKAIANMEAGYSPVPTAQEAEAVQNPQGKQPAEPQAQYQAPEEPVAKAQKAQQVNMKPLPEQRPPRRQGGI